MGWTLARRSAKSSLESGKRSRGGGGEPATARNASRPPRPNHHRATQNPSCSDQSVTSTACWSGDRPGHCLGRVPARGLGRPRKRLPPPPPASARAAPTAAGSWEPQLQLRARGLCPNTRPPGSTWPGGEGAKVQGERLPHAVEPVGDPRMSPGLRGARPGPPRPQAHVGRRLRFCLCPCVSGALGKAPAAASCCGLGPRGSLSGEQPGHPLPRLVSGNTVRLLARPSEPGFQAPVPTGPHAASSGRRLEAAQAPWVRRLSISWFDALIQAFTSSREADARK